MVKLLIIGGDHTPLTSGYVLNRMKGEDCHNWKGGIHKRSDGYWRINIDGKRYLQHRVLAGLKDMIGKVVHHKDGNPSNNDLINLKVFDNQAEHVKYEKDNAFTPNTN